METTISTRVASSERLHAAFASLRTLDLPDSASGLVRTGLDIAEIVRTLDADDDVVIAAMVQPLLDAKLLDATAAEKQFGADATRLALTLRQLGEFGLSSDWRPEQGLEPGQAEALRKMLLAVIGDVRLVVVRLAGQLQKMRAAEACDGDPRSVCASGQPVGGVAIEMGTGRSGLPVPAARRLQAHRRRSQD